MLEGRGRRKRQQDERTMGERLFDVIKSGLMIKRSQNKNRFTLINYKTRWFELTRQCLSYFDIENYEVSHHNNPPTDRSIRQHRKCKTFRVSHARQAIPN